MKPPVPFTQEDQLFNLGDLEAIPGHPHLRLHDTPSLSSFLQAELSTRRLSELYKILFLTSKPRNISPLHHQAVKGRKILITEQPDLHLITYPGRIFIKPLPLWLISYSFYEEYLARPRPEDGDPAKEAQGSGDLAKEAHGFLRTYASLIRHESDLYIAKREKLVPPTVKWDDWCRFIQQLRYPFVTSSEHVETKSWRSLLVDAPPLYSDTFVAERYHYGEIGLIRLNLWCFLTLREWEYMPVHYDYATYFARYLAPYLFVFGALTVILTAMQVELAAHPDGPYADISYAFVGFTIALTGVSCVFFPALYFFFAVRELYFYFVYFRDSI